MYRYLKGRAAMMNNLLAIIIDCRARMLIEGDLCNEKSYSRYSGMKEFHYVCCFLLYVAICPFV